MSSDKRIYDETIDTSLEMSLQKALAIFLEEQEKNKPPVIRPNVNPFKGLCKIFIVLILIGVVCFLLHHFGYSAYWGLLLLVPIFLLFGKKTIIWLVLLYQKYAPEELRRACLYEPTCSNYMILSLRKYGLIKGLFKGIGRLFRCHSPNGGVDNP